MIKDFFASFYNVREYPKFIKKSGAHTFLFAVIITAIALAFGVGLITYAFNKKELGDAFISAVSQGMPIEYKNKELIINKGQPFTFKFGDAKSGPFDIVYEPQRVFPPTVAEFNGLGSMIILNKKNVFVLREGNVTIYDIETLVSAGGVDTAENFTVTEEMLHSAVPEFMGMIKMIINASLLVAIPFVFLWYCLVSALAGLLLNMFMGRGITGGKIFKLAVYMQAPMMLLTLLFFMVPGFSFGTLLRLCLSAALYYPIFMQLPKKGANDADKSAA